MNIFIYSDESGVFDKEHYQYYVYGGVMFLNKDSRDIASRKFKHAEDVVKKKHGMDPCEEAKACKLSNKDKSSLFRSLNNVIKFGVIIELDKLNRYIWETPKHKQRFLDYAYKIAVKRCFENLIARKSIVPEEITNLFFFVDEHTTATNGKYELCESMEQEFKIGTFSSTWCTFHPPIFKNLESVRVEYKDSKSSVLVRSADIVANRIYFHVRTDPQYFSNSPVFYVIRLP